MRKIYIAGEGREFNYPADLMSQQIIATAGGRRTLTEDQQKQVKYKTVRTGQDCSDMPVEVRDLYVSRGWVIEQTVEEVKPTPVATPTEPLDEEE